MNNIQELIKPINKNLIDKVPLKNIISGDGSSKVNKNIQLLCKKVLLKSLNRTDGERFNEVGILARLDNSSEIMTLYGHYIKELNTCKIDTEDEYYIYAMENERKDSLVFVHNHPNNSNVSISDILKLYIDFPVKVVVAVYNDCSFVSYAMRSSNNLQAYIKIYNTIITKYIQTNKISELYKEMIDNPDKFGLILEMR